MNRGYSTIAMPVGGRMASGVAVSEKLVMDNPTPEAKKASVEVHGTLPARVLIAEDEHLVATSMVELLHDLQVGVIGPVSNGQEAVELAGRDRPDMALLDIRMPIMDGLEAAQALYGRMGIPVIIFSAYSDPVYVDRGTAAGIFGYMLKPVTGDDLRVGLTMAWSRYRQQVKLGQEIDGLKTAIEERKIVERAKGLIMDRLCLGEAEAMRRLQKQARDTRRKLFDVARGILESDHLLNGRDGHTKP